MSHTAPQPPPHEASQTPAEASASKAVPPPVAREEEKKEVAAWKEVVSSWRKRIAGWWKRVAEWFDKHRRTATAVIGYTILAVFAAGYVVARSSTSLSPVASVVAGALLAAPLVLAFVGSRITGLKLSFVEISLSQVEVEINADFSKSIQEAADMGESLDTHIRTGVLEAIHAPDEVRVLRLNLRDDDYWYSTRLFLVAALAAEYTHIDQLLFVRDKRQPRFVGLIAPELARRRLASQFPQYDHVYCSLRSNPPTAPGSVLAAESEATRIIGQWSTQFLPDGEASKPKVSSQKLQEWLYGDLDTESLPHEPLTPRLRFQINARPHRYTALTFNETVQAVIDGDKLARLTTEAVLRTRLG